MGLGLMVDFMVVLYFLGGLEGEVGVFHGGANCVRDNSVLIPSHFGTKLLGAILNNRRLPAGSATGMWRIKGLGWERSLSFNLNRCAMLDLSPFSNGRSRYFLLRQKVSKKRFPHDG